MDIRTRLLTFKDRLHYRWLEDEFDEIRALRYKLAVNGALAPAKALDVGLVHRMHELAVIATRLRRRGVGPLGYAMGNVEMLWALVLAATIIGGLLVSITQGAV